MNSERALLSPDVTITLSNCDLEPIHIPSFIQPHGLLLAARLPDLRIVYTSANSLEILGVAPPPVLTMTLTELLGIGAVTSIQDALKGEQYLPNNILLLNFAVAGLAKFDAVAHHSGNFLCVELELAEERVKSDSIATRMEGAIRELGRAKTVNGLCSAFAPLVRSLTGYDRVMVYRFDRDGHGEIVAEAKDPEMEPYLGLHYPATDIPASPETLPCPASENHCRRGVSARPCSGKSRPFTRRTTGHDLLRPPQYLPAAHRVSAKHEGRSHFRNFVDSFQ
jgi:light-regulated signal transduction histidine kinase (bacteriophytochrome)